jgi:hypothetical protein
MRAQHAKSRDHGTLAQEPCVNGCRVDEEGCSHEERAGGCADGWSFYHLNAEDEPEHPDYFRGPELRKRFGTRGAIHTWANPDGTQKIESTGPLTKKRMETIDEEVTREALRVQTQSELAVALYAALREAGIESPVPQREARFRPE